MFFHIHFRLHGSIFDFLCTLTIIPVELLDIENIGIAVGISLLWCIQAEIHVIPYPLPVTGRHLWYITHSDFGECFQWPYLFLNHKMAVSIGSWLISHSYYDIYSYICCASRHFEFIWVWLIILRHIRYYNKCAWALLRVGENSIKQNFNPFRRYSGLQRLQIQCTPTQFTLQ